MINHTKIFGTTILIGITSACLMACGSSTGTTTVTKAASNTSESSSVAENSVQNESTAKQTLQLDEKYSIENYADITLLSIESTKKITSTMDQGIYFEPTQTDNTYIDMVFDITNTNTENINSEDLLKISAVGEDGTSYKGGLYVVETNDMTNLSQYEEIAPLSTVRFHAACPVSEKGSKFTLNLDVNGSLFSYDFKLDAPVKISENIHIGDTIEAADYATLEFVSAEFTDAVLPTNTSGYYNYYHPDNADNTYLALQFNITNYQSNAKDIDTFVNAQATFLQKYKYTCFVCSEDDDQQGFNTYNDIKPLQTAKVYCLIEVPKSVQDKEFSVDIFFNKKTYVYTNQ